MGQMGFFDIANRYAGLDTKNDPLVKIDAVVSWEDFRVHHRRRGNPPPIAYTLIETAKLNGVDPQASVIFEEAIKRIAMIYGIEKQARCCSPSPDYSPRVSRFDRA